MSQKKDHLKLQHDIRFQEKLWDAAEHTVMSEALNEALSCRKCTLGVSKATMATDIEQGKYIASRYPPFFPNPQTRDENISPLDTTAAPTDFTYWKIISEAQRQKYYELVEQNLNNLLDERPSTDAEVSVLFAHYQVDYHIQAHYLSRRGMLTLCRDASDMQALRKWHWKMSEIDAVIQSDIESKREWPSGCRKLGWPNDENLQMVHQTLLWKRAWRGRQRRLEEVRARWAVIMEERRRERELLLLKEASRFAKEASTFTVKVYCGGELRDRRELKRTAYSEPGLRVKRAAHSFVV